MQKSIKNLLKNTGLNCDYDIAINGITSDSRSAKKGFLFCALSDCANQYIKDAILKGVTAVLSSSKSHKDKKVLSIFCNNPRDVYHKICKNFYPKQPEHLCAVTGTNGKTSVCDFFRQICLLSGRNAANIGTIGTIKNQDVLQKFNLTCPDAAVLHKTLNSLKADGVDYVALEASSHGIVQKRIDSAKLKAAAFTNLSRDHLDYHGCINSYFEAKLRLFTKTLPQDDVAVVNTDDEFGKTIAESCLSLKKLIKVGNGNGCDIRIANQKLTENGQNAKIVAFGKNIVLDLQLFGKFQIKNLAIAIGLAHSLGINVYDVDYSQISAPPGRMQLIKKDGKIVFIDYAHTPDALLNALLSLKSHFLKKDIILVFGCGGNRDKKKRKLMGKIAMQHAKKIVVCDDNPRLEDPATIRADIISGCAGAAEIACRKTAIKYALYNCSENDIILIAGRGHEAVQDFGNFFVQISDAELVGELACS